MGTEGRKRLSLIQMILLTHLKAGFENGNGWSAGLFAGDGFLTAVTVYFAVTPFPNAAA